MLISTVQTVMLQEHMLKKSVGTNVKCVSVSIAGVKIWNTLKMIYNCLKIIKN